MIKLRLHQKKKQSLSKKEFKGEFVDNAHKKAELIKIQDAKAAAERAKNEIEKKKQKSDGISDVEGRLIDKIKIDRTPSTIALPTLVTPNLPLRDDEKDNDNKSSWRTDKLSTYSKKERKLISKIFSIIVTSTDKRTAENLIKKIEDELQ